MPKYPLILVEKSDYDLLKDSHNLKDLKKPDKFLH